MTVFDLENLIFGAKFEIGPIFAEILKKFRSWVSLSKIPFKNILNNERVVRRVNYFKKSKKPPMEWIFGSPIFAYAHSDPNLD